jgi:hypothetical protein
MTARDQTLVAYGALREGAHIAGYTFERVCTHLEWLLQEGRWREVGQFDDVNDFLSGIKLDALRVSAEQRKRIATLIKSLQPEASQRRIAGVLGVNQATVHRDLTDANASATDKNSPNIRTNDGPGDANASPPPTIGLSGASAARLAQARVEKDRRAEATRQKRALSRSAEPLPDGMDLRIGDCREVLADIPDASVALVLTDPPYAGESEPLYQWLAEFAARVLIPGGSLVCYTGHWSIPRDTQIFGEHLRYWWILSMNHHQSERFPGKFVIANHKPILWYVKSFRRGRTLVPDVLLPPQREKDDHEWGQGEGGVTHLIEHLTEPGELIVDPFAGTATWGRIAASMGRRWIGADIADGGTTDIEAEPLMRAAE